MRCYGNVIHSVISRELSGQLHSFRKNRVGTYRVNIKYLYKIMPSYQRVPLQFGRI